MEKLVTRRGVPAHIRSDNGSEFVARTLQGWLADRQVKTLYIEPASPWQNGHVESFHGSLRNEGLDRELMLSVAEARVAVEDYRRYYNEVRPHGGIGYRTPAQACRITVTAVVPVVKLTATTPTVTLGSGEIGEFTITLSAPQTTELNVTYTLKGSGVNGTDYVLLSGTKRFNPGITSKPIKIEPLGDLGGVDKKSVKVTLAPGPGYNVGTTTFAKVLILRLIRIVVWGRNRKCQLQGLPYVSTSRFRVWLQR